MAKSKQTGKFQLSQISNYSDNQINTFLSFISNVEDFKKVLALSKKDYAEFKDNHGRDKVKGVWTNRFGNEELVTFSSSFEGRNWEPDEIKSLLHGDPISVSAQDENGEPYEISGYLDTYTYMGNHQVGFKVAPKETPVQSLSKAQRERMAKLDFEFIDDVDIEADATEMDEPSL